MTSTQISLVNKEIDDHFTEQYGKTDFLSMFNLNESNWAKTIKGERKMPKVFKVLMLREKRILKLEKALDAVAPDVDTETLLRYLEDDERETINDLRIELDKYKSALRMVQNIQKAANTIIEKVEK
jgi:hypothetical protein